MNEVINQYFDWDAARPYFPDLARGFWVTIQIAFLAEVLCLGLGLLLAVARQAGRGARTPAGRARRRRRARRLAVAYINIFRAVPALLVLLLMAGSFPFLPIPVVQDLTHLPDRAASGWASSYAAYVAEVYRAGIESVDRGQTEAARSLGMGARPGDAPDRAAPGRAARAAAADERLHRAHQGRRPGQRPGRPRRRQRGARRAVGHVQLVHARRRRGLLHRLHAAAHLAARPDHRARPAAPGPRGDRRRRDRHPRRGPGQALRRQHRPARGRPRGAPTARSSASSGPRARASRRCCAASTCSSVPTEGRVFLGDDELTAPGAPVDALRRRMGMVFQSFNLFPHRTVLDNVTLAPIAGARRRPRDGPRERHGAARPGGPGGQAPASTPAASRGASSSASRSPAPWRWSPRRCCSTRSRARSTRSW